MQFASPPRRPPREAIVPMINVVFLLLIFFLMTATLTPPAPLSVTPPAAQGADPQAEGRALLFAADGTLAFGTDEGEAALVAALMAALGAPTAGGPLTLRADADLPGAALAALLARLAAGGADEVRLVTSRTGRGAAP